MMYNKKDTSWLQYGIYYSHKKFDDTGPGLAQTTKQFFYVCLDQSSSEIRSYPNLGVSEGST